MKPERFRDVLNDIAWDMQRYTHRVEGSSPLQILILSPGFQAVLFYRLAHWVFPISSRKKGWTLLLAFAVAMMRRFVIFTTGIDIEPGAEIGPGLLMLHGENIVIGPCQIGRNCDIYQGVTLGVSKPLDPRVPTLGDRVYLAPGAKVMGAVTLGNDVVVGPNTVVLNTVADRSVMLGVPGRVMGKTGSFDLVLYPGMEEDPERQASIAMMEEARVEPPAVARPVTNLTAAVNSIDMSA